MSLGWNSARSWGLLRCSDRNFYGFDRFDAAPNCFLVWCLCLRRRLTKTQTNRHTARNSMAVKALASTRVSRFICRNIRSTATVSTSTTNPILRTRFSRASNEEYEEFTEGLPLLFDWHFVSTSFTCPDLESQFLSLQGFAL